MATPRELPNDLAPLLHTNEVRPKGRRHRSDERQTYGAYPSIVNQSFVFERPPAHQSSSNPAGPYRQPRASRAPSSQSRPATILATASLTSRPCPTMSTNRTSSRQNQPTSFEPTRDTSTLPAPSLPPRPPAHPLAHQPSVDGIGSWGDFAHIIPFVDTDAEVLSAQTAPVMVVTVNPVRHEEVIAKPSLAPTASYSNEAIPPRVIQPAKPAQPDIEPPSILDELEEDISCPICMNVMVGPCLLSPCGHALCGPCIVPWLETRASTGEQTNCPVCRERVSKRHPLVPSHNLDAMVNRWVEHKMKKGPWDGHEDWEERKETWKIHRKFTPSLISPELFNRHSHTVAHSPTASDSATPNVIANPTGNRLQNVVSPPDVFGSLPLMRSALLDGVFPDHRQSYFDTGNSYVHPPPNPFQALIDMSSRFEAIRNNILQDMAMARSRQ